MNPLRTLIPAALLMLPLAAPAASFDCTKAHLPDERAICASRALNDRDVVLATLYRIDKGFMGMGARGALMDAQTAWLNQRHACGANRPCLTRLYDSRIAELERVIDHVKSNGPF